jgi:hypothetical protein
MEEERAALAARQCAGAPDCGSPTRVTVAGARRLENVIKSLTSILAWNKRYIVADRTTTSESSGRDPALTAIAGRR